MTTKSRMIAVGVIAPLAIGLIGQVFALLSLPALPDPVAIHWGPTGVADGFGPAAITLLLLPVLVLGYSALAFVVTRSPGESVTVNQRVILAIGPYLATLLSIIVAGSFAIQAGLADARDAPSILPTVGIGFGLAVLAGVLAWFALPAHTHVSGVESEEVPSLPLSETQRVTWTRTIEPSKTIGVVVALLFIVLIVGGGVALWAVAPVPTFVLYTSVLLFALALVGSMVFWRVTIDSKGIRVRSAIGVPRFEIAIDDIDQAGVAQIDPTRDFGGWGVRWGGPGRLGIVMRRGEALEVRRKNGKSLVVTVGGARTAAALINSLAQRVQ